VAVSAIGLGATGLTELLLTSLAVLLGVGGVAIGWAGPATTTATARASPAGHDRPVLLPLEALVRRRKVLGEYSSAA
jgi:hypothetical protein